MTQAEFAALLHVDRKTVVRWETGLRMPDCDSLLNMKQRLRISIDWLLTGQGKAADAGALAAEDLQALEGYRVLDADGKRAVLRAMQMEQLRARAEALEPVARSGVSATRLEQQDIASSAPLPKVRRVPKPPKT